MNLWTLRKSLLLLLGMVVLFGTGLLRSGAAPAQDHNKNVTSGNTLTFEVAIDGDTFKYDQGVLPSVDFLKGDTFILWGKIFPADSLPLGAARNDPNAAGSIGTWICRGTFVLDQVEDNGTKPHVITTQTFLFDNGSSLSSDGLEGNVEVLRAVIGGTARYFGAAGEVTEKPLGTNITGLDNARFDFRLKHSK